MAIPKIISVDDHVVEPPDLWSSRLPERFRARGPRIVRERGKFGGPLGLSWIPDPAGEWADIWYYEDLVSPFSRLSAAVGLGDLAFGTTTFDEIRPGCWKQKERLADMDANHVEASICFPNTLPRFCGQTFMERQDKDLSLLCVRAYNDWIIDEWCAGEGRGRLIPLSIIPLWDVELAVEEIHRTAKKGCHAVTFSENPHPLGLPSVHSGYWDPFYRACEETETVVCLHIGSSSKMPQTTPDAPFIVSSTLTFQNAMGSLIDYVFSGILERFPRLRIAYSEGQVGWMPYVLERMDKLWHERVDNSFGSGLKQPPSSYLGDRILGCIFDDETGLANRDRIGMHRISFEVDYPHADSTFPHTEKTASEICAKAGLSEAETYALLRGNAIRLFQLERFGITR